MKKKQVLATLCAGMMVASVATGCSSAADSAADSTAASTDSTNASTEASSASTTADGKTQLNILWWGSQTRHELTTQMLEKFQEENPDIEVVMDYSDWDGYWTKLPAQVAGGQTPMFSRWTTPSWHSMLKTALWHRWMIMLPTAALT